ncbi:MAG TPA: hypothetical protein VMV18_01195, partial [bacterium]|nr:hypothetical protein [bacterium]
ERTLTLTIEPFGGLHREVFTSPVTGRPYTAAGIDFAHRFDTNRAGARASAELELADGTDAWGALSWQRVDYVDDFRGVPLVDRWDYGELRADVDAYYYPPSSQISAAYAFRRRAYDARYPHDALGNQVLPGTGGYVPQVFDFHDVSIKGGLEGDGAHALARFDVERRLDEYGGYLDYWDTSLDLDLRLETGVWTLGAAPSISLRVYDVARVNYDPVEPSSRRTRIDVPFTVERGLDANFSVWVEAGWTDQWSSNSLYTWRGISAASGVRFRVR